VASFVTGGAFPATRPKTKKTTATTKVSQATAPAVPLAALFPAPSPEIASAGGMVTMDAPNHEVVMVRINDDGTRSHACVNDEAAARKFLAATNTATPAKKEN
jgi:hypothetical protein